MKKLLLFVLLFAPCSWGATATFNTSTRYFEQPNLYHNATNGSAALPAFTFHLDADTGMYRSAADTIGWATAGTARLTLSGTVLSPASNDGLALGSTSLMWSDLFLASGSVLNWNNGDLSLTHSANTLTLTGGNLIASGPGITLDASGFDGNLTSDDNTFQEIAQKVDDLSVGSGGVSDGDKGEVVVSGGGAVWTIEDAITVATWTMTGAPGLALNNGATSGGVIRIVEDSDNGSNYAEITVPALGSNRTLTAPDASGVFALEADASGFNGNLATTDNTLQEIAQKLDDLSVGSGVSDGDKGDVVVSGGGAIWTIEDAITVATWTMTGAPGLTLNNGSSSSGVLRIAEDSDNGSNYAEITVPASLGGNRTLTTPDASGVLALEADASGFDGNLATTDNTLQEVAQKFDDFVASGGVSDGDKGEVVVSGGGAVWTIEDAITVATWTMTGAPGLSLNNGSTSAGVLRIVEDSDNGSNYAEITVPALGSNRTLTAPDASGVLALEADASGFNGNLSTTDNTLQEIAQKLDDLAAGPGGSSGGSVPLQIQSVKFPSSSPAVLDGGETNWRLLFDDSTDETVTWQFVMPDNYGSSPTLRVVYSMNNATANAVYMQASVMAVTPGDSADINTESYDTANSGNDTVPGTAGYMDAVVITLTNMDSAAAGDLIKIRLNRDADNGSDNAAGDLEVVGVIFEYD